MKRDADRAWIARLPWGCDSNDWGNYALRLRRLALARGFNLDSLGEIDGRPLLLLTRSVERGPRVMIASGFHGEESAGPWGVLEFLAKADSALLEQASLALLPLVNVTGFEAGRRLNRWGENPNRGYTGDDGAGASREGSLLLAAAERLLPLARDGLLTCHEDILLSHCYLYALEPGSMPGQLSQELLKVNATYFPVHPDGEVDGCPIRGGIVFNHQDTSFDCWMVREGARRAACVETPGQYPITRRIAAQAAMMQCFIENVDSTGRSPQR